MTDLETIKSLQEELDSIVENQNETKKQCEEMKRINDEREQLFKELAERNIALSVELDIKTADLAQMKSTLSETQQTLRSVQEDRDEFAAKMNDAVERAERLESELSDTKRQYEWSRLERDRMEKYGQFERGLINALQFALLCVTGNTERVNGIDWLWNVDSMNFKDNV